MDKYYLALGRFIQEYAQVEVDLYLLLILTARVDFKVAPAIFSGTRSAAAISFLKRIHESRGKELPRPLADAFAQLNTITTARDHILHMGSRVAQDGSLRSSNEIRAHADRSVRVLDTSPAVLVAMTEDLSRIGQILFQFQIPENIDGAVDATLIVTALGLVGPWRYRPSEPGIPGPRTPSTTRKPKAQPPTSPK